MMRSVVRRAVVAAGAVAAVLGTGAGVAVAAPAPVALAWSPSSFNFGTLLTPGGTSSQVFTLENTGGGGSSGLTVTVAPSSAYSIKAGTDTCTGKSLGQNKSCTVTVTFIAPATQGNYPGTLTATGFKPNVTAQASLTGQSGKATPEISTTPQPALGLARTPVADQVTVTSPDSPGGMVTFNLYSAADCDPGSLVFRNAFVPLNNGTALSAGITPPTDGTYYWQVTYSGDANNNSVTSTCGEPVTISACVVADTTSGQAFADLPDAVAAAASGDTLTVEGTCTGTTEIGNNLTLTLTGQAAQPSPTATLDGGGNGSVLTIDSGATVTLNTLTITGGTGTTAGAKGTQGGGILNNGTLTVNGSTITGNTASFMGGGIYNYYTGTATLNNSTVTGNTAGARGGGGGIFNLGTVTLTNTPLTGNTTLGVGGGIYMGLGTLTLNNSTIGGSGSSSGNSASDGGGIFVDGGTVTLNNSSSITGNTASIDGGGVFGQDGTVTLDSTSSITGNNPNDCSGVPTFTGCTGGS